MWRRVIMKSDAPPRRYCWRIQSQLRKLFKLRWAICISSLFGKFANNIRVAARTRGSRRAAPAQSAHDGGEVKALEAQFWFNSITFRFSGGDTPSAGTGWLLIVFH